MPPEWLRWPAVALVFLGFVLGVAGLLTPGPTLAGFESKGLAQAEPARGVLRITRHPFLWGVAGAILWKLVRERVAGRRAEFTNRELRLDASLRLPELSDNLEARLILLARRLEERVPSMRIVKTGRGRFRLDVSRPLQLLEVT